MSHTMDDILNSFTDDPDDPNEYMEAYQNYRRRYSRLSRYNILMPYQYASEIKPGVLIRYSERIDKISPAVRVIKVHKDAITSKIVKLVIKNIEQRDSNNDNLDSSTRDLYPDMYYVFKYDPSGSKFNRQLRQAIGDTSNLEDPKIEQSIRSRIKVDGDIEKKYAKPRDRDSDRHKKQSNLNKDLIEKLASSINNNKN